MTGSNTRATNLRGYLSATAAVPPYQAALLAAGVAEQLTVLHLDGRVHGPLGPGARVELGDGSARVVLDSRGTRAGSGDTAEDVAEVGVLLGRLLGVSVGPGRRLPPRPVSVPGPLWSVVVDALGRDPAARPAAAIVARRLRDAARDLLLGVDQWPSSSGPGDMTGEPPGYVPGGPDDGRDRPDPGSTARPRRWRRAMVVAAVVLLVIAAVMTFALAPDDRTPQSPPSTGGASASRAAPSMETCERAGCAARVTFVPADDRFTVCDRSKDGLSAVAVYSRGDQPGERTVWASGGVGTCVNHTAHMPPGTRVTVKACTGDRPTNRIVVCGDPITGVA